MASVKFELRNEGKGLHEWDYMPLSEERVVRMLIQNRSKLDATYEMKQVSENPFVSQGAAPMSEPVMVTYLDLDRLIATCGLEEDEREVVGMLMRGYNRKDVAELRGVTTGAVNMLLDAAVIKIVAKNNDEWRRVMGATLNVC